MYTYFCHYYGSIIEKHKMHLAFLLECCGVMVKNFNKKGICPIRKSKNWIYGVIRPYTFSFFYYISYILYIPHLSSYIWVTMGGFRLVNEF